VGHPLEVKKENMCKQKINKEECKVIEPRKENTGKRSIKFKEE